MAELTDAEVVRSNYLHDEDTEDSGGEVVRAVNVL